MLWQKFYKPRRLFIPTYTVALLGPQVVANKEVESKTPHHQAKKDLKQSKKVEPPPEKKSGAAWKLPKEEKKPPTPKKPRKKVREKSKKKVKKTTQKAKATKQKKRNKQTRKTKQTRQPAPEAQIAKALAKISREVGQVKRGSSAGMAANTRAVETRFQNYYNLISKKVKEEWVFPPEVDEGERLEAIVTITISRNGSLRKVELESTSGNVFFDRSVLRAVRKASPFSPLPKEYMGRDMEIGIRFRP